MKKSDFLFILPLLLCSLSVTRAYPQDSQLQILTANNVLSVNGTEEYAIGDECYKDFKVEASEGGDYYAQFWLLPAQLADDGFSTFKVYVNGSFAGYIKPVKGNWQSAAVEKNKPLRLKRGENVISISTEAPEYPSVEFVRISKRLQAAALQDNAYASYVDKAKASTGVPEQAATRKYVVANSAGGYSVIKEDVPLKYSFYAFYEFTEGQEVYLTSSSQRAHDIDLFYSHLIVYSYLTPIGNPQQTIIRKTYFPASPEKIQGLNWKAPSELSLDNSGKYVATKRVVIPKTGRYMVKLRSRYGTLGVADLNVNDEYFYEDVPIYFSHVDYEIPADGRNHSIFTFSNDMLGMINPVLFIEGAGASRIVGYNDNLLNTNIPHIGGFVSTAESCVDQAYIFKATGLHVGNSSSVSPEATCSVMETAYGGVQANNLFLRNQAKDAREADDGDGASLPANDVVITPDVAALSSSVSIASHERIESVSAYGLSGVETAMVSVGGYDATIPLADLNITGAGVYVLKVKTEKGVVTHKILVR